MSKTKIMCCLNSNKNEIFELCFNLFKRIQSN